MADERTSSNDDQFASPCTELVRIGTLRPNPRNARTHSKKQIALIKGSLEKFGQMKPVIVDDEDIILAGHGFVEAARLAGLTHVSIIRFGHLTETQKARLFNC